jgi:Kef-type K+ transport system membrane component KefB
LTAALPLAPAADSGAPVPVILAALTIMLAAAKLGGDLATRARQPAVLGELIAGVVLGNLGLLGWTAFEGWKANPTLDVLAQIGVVILLFEVGLESTVHDMLKVGMTATLVAVLGVLAPFLLGWMVGALLLPGASPYTHAFLGATLTATSVGITARVLQDLGKSKTAEARVILGAAVVDDVLGLVILAVLSGVIGSTAGGNPVDYGTVGVIVGKAALFLIGSIVLGLYLSPRLFGLASRLSGRGVLLGTALVFCFALSYLASRIGLAAIVGAYAAGLILEDVHYKSFTERGERQLGDLLHPIAAFLVPLFFVLMGMRVDLTSFARPEILGLAALLTVAAIVGKQACALGAIGGRLDRLSIGIGMIPRGEVGLIFANLGLGLTLQGTAIIDRDTYSAIVIMVIVTTLVTPPALRWSLERRAISER